MKSIRICIYSLKQGLQNLVKNFFMVLASVCVVLAVLLVMGALFLTSKNLSYVIEQFANRAQVQINFSYLVTEEEAQEIADVIAEDSRVMSVKYISKEENLNAIIEYFADEKELFESYKDSEQLQYVSLEIQLYEYADGQGFVDEAVQIDGVDNVKNIVDTVNKMEVIVFWVRISTIIAVILMLLFSILLIFNTVKLTVFARRKEIEIMKFVGATNSYIYAPFIIEGVITGIVGSVVAHIALKVIYNLIYKKITNAYYFDNFELIPFEKCGGIYMLLAFVGFGIISGLVASALAVSRHIDV